MNHEPQFTRLRIYNIFMGFLHLAQAVFIIILSNDFKLPITTSFLTLQEESGRLWPATDTLVNLPLGIMVAVFLLLSAVAHFTVASPGTFGWYVRNLKRGMNPARFYEYALSSSLMIVLIGLLTGVWDLGAVLLAFGVNAMMNLFGIMMELHNQTTDRTNWTAFIYGLDLTKELARHVPAASNLKERLSGRVQLLDAEIASIRDPQVAFVIHDQCFGL